MLDDMPFDVPQLGGGKAIAGGEGHGTQPVLRLAVAPRDVNVRRFGASGAVKMKAIWANAKDRRHQRSVPAESVESNLVRLEMAGVRANGKRNWLSPRARDARGGAAVRRGVNPSGICCLPLSTQRTERGP
jgi:hypothetical protein